jgi:hypothetical protein
MNTIKHLLLLTTFFLSTVLANAQLSFAIEPELSFGLMSHKYTGDSLVPPNRKYTMHVGSFTYTGALFSIQPQGSKWKFFTGIGYQTNYYTLHKDNGIDNVFSIFDFFGSLFGGDPVTDSHPYQTVKLRNNNLVFPVGFSFNDSNPNKKRGIQTQMGLRANMNVAINGKASVKFVVPADASQVAAAEKTYIDLYNPFTVSVMPFLCFKGRNDKKLQWQWTWLPLIFYTSNQMSRIYSREIGSGMSVSASYKL